jgi:hypothetical protein
MTTFESLGEALLVDRITQVKTNRPTQTRRAIYFIYYQPPSTLRTPRFSFVLSLRTLRPSRFKKIGGALCTELILVENYEPAMRDKPSPSRAGSIVGAIMAVWHFLIYATAQG